MKTLIFFTLIGGFLIQSLWGQSPAEIISVDFRPNGQSCFSSAIKNDTIFSLIQEDETNGSIQNYISIYLSNIEGKKLDSVIIKDKAKDIKPHQLYVPNSDEYLYVTAYNRSSITESLIYKIDPQKLTTIWQCTVPGQVIDILFLNKGKILLRTSKFIAGNPQNDNTPSLISYGYLIETGSGTISIQKEIGQTTSIIQQNNFVAASSNKINGQFLVYKWDTNWNLLTIDTLPTQFETYSDISIMSTSDSVLYFYGIKDSVPKARNIHIYEWKADSNSYSNAPKTLPKITLHDLIRLDQTKEEFSTYRLFTQEKGTFRSGHSLFNQEGQPVGLWFSNHSIFEFNYDHFTVKKTEYHLPLLKNGSYFINYMKKIDEGKILFGGGMKNNDKYDSMNGIININR